MVRFTLSLFDGQNAWEEVVKRRDMPARRTNERGGSLAYEKRDQTTQEGAIAQTAG
jgi:hypothetical protein